MINSIISVTFNLPRINKKIENSLRIEDFSKRVSEDSNKYAMEDTGELMKSMEVSVQSKTKAVITWNPVSPKGEHYGKKAYWMPQSRVRVEKNPKAHSMWFHFAKSLHLSEWIKRS